MNNYLALVSLSVAGMLLLAGCQEHTQRSEKMTESFQNTLEKHHSRKHIIQGDPQRRELEVPGISAAVIYPDGTAWLGVSGKSSESEAMSSAMLFGLGSVTKTYIAALVLQLVEEGSLSIEDSVGEWIPELGQIDKEITVRQLLNHTSGLYRYQQKPEYLNVVLAQPEKVWTAEEILASFQGEPETGFGESAMDYVLLGMIIEKATGTSVSHQLQSRFFEPLKLEHTFLYPEQQFPPEMMAHMWWDVAGMGEPIDVVASAGELPLAALFSSVWTSGAMYATAEELARFVKALFEGDVLEPEFLGEMMSHGPELDASAHYGYSVIIDQVGGQAAYWHPGGLGYSSIYFYFPEEEISIAVLGNLMVDLKPVATDLYEAYVEHRRD